MSTTFWFLFAKELRFYVLQMHQRQGESLHGMRLKQLSQLSENIDILQMLRTLGSRSTFGSTFIATRMRTLRFCTCQNCTFPLLIVWSKGPTSGAWVYVHSYKHEDIEILLMLNCAMWFQVNSSFLPSRQGTQALSCFSLFGAEVQPRGLVTNGERFWGSATFVWGLLVPLKILNSLCKKANRKDLLA